MHGTMHLGRIRPTSRQRAQAPRLRDYMTRPLPKAPPECRNSDGARLGMWGNDSEGCCVFAACANTREIVAARAGLPSPPTTTANVHAAYRAYTHGQDSGANENEVLTLAQASGLDLGGPEPWMLAAWVSVPLGDTETCKALISVFHSLFLGVELPNTAKTQKVWDVGAGRDAVPGSWGGHALLWSDYDDAKGLYGFPTWGMVQPVTPAWLDEYGDEAYCLLPADRASEVGIDWEALSADLQYMQAA